MSTPWYRGSKALITELYVGVGGRDLQRRFLDSRHKVDGFPEKQRQLAVLHLPFGSSFYPFQAGRHGYMYPDSNFKE